MTKFLQHAYKTQAIRKRIEDWGEDKTLTS